MRALRPPGMRRLRLGVLAGAFMLAGCGDASKLHGAWENEAGEIELEFLRNGDVIWTQSLGALNGTWEIVEGERVKLNFGGVGALLGAQYCRYERTRATLTLSGECLVAGRFTRRTS